MKFLPITLLLFCSSFRIIDGYMGNTASNKSDEDGSGFNMETFPTRVEPTKVGDTYHIIVSPGEESEIQSVKSESGETDTDIDTETYTITHPGASYISVHFNSFDLPNECSMDVTNGDGTQSSTLTGKGRLQQGSFWAQHITGDVIKLKLKCHGKAPIFDIDTYAAGYPDQNSIVSEPEVRNLRGKYFMEAMGDRRELSICGVDDKRNAICYQTSHPAMYQKARAVARLLMNGTRACTGWLVSGSNLLFTNAHCINSLSTVQNTDFEFMGEELTCTNVPGDGSWFGNRGDIHEGTDLIAADASWDYALVQLDTSRNPAATYGFLEVDNRLPDVGELLYIPQHAAGRPKELGIIDTNESDNQCKVKGYGAGCAPSDMMYSCDTAGGSSGSPVLSRTNNKVVALHHCGGGCAGNLGAPIEKFYSDVKGFLLHSPPYLNDYGAVPPSTNLPLQLCEGDCDADSECDVGLKCFQRDGLSSVPGCSGDGRYDYDYCTEPPLNDYGANPPSTNLPLQLCEGDCDADSECDVGLKCFQRDGLSSVPGCYGYGKHEYDYCILSTVG